MMAGYKTIIFSLAVIALGVLQMPEFSALTGGCIFDAAASQPATCMIPASTVASIGGIMALLRIITTSAIFKK